MNKTHDTSALAEKIAALRADHPRAIDEAISYVRSTLADGGQPEEQLKAGAEAAGITEYYLQEAQRRLNLSLSGSPWVMRLEQAACIVCDASTDSVEPDYRLPVCPSCTSPIETWTWHRRRQDGKRGWEVFKASRRMDCWRTGANERTRRPGSAAAHMDTCCSVFDRAGSGRPMCDQPVIWKVTRTIGRRGSHTVWCDVDLPADLRPASAELTV